MMDTIHRESSIDTEERRMLKLEEVCSLLSVKPQVLRFWEAEFSHIKNIRGKGGQKLYRPEDVEMLIEIQNLLEQKNCSLSEARTMIEQRVSDQTMLASNASIAPAA